MILFQNNLLQGLLLMIPCLNCVIYIIKGCCNQLKLACPDCPEGRKSIEHNNIPFEMGVGEESVAQIILRAGSKPVPGVVQSPLVLSRVHHDNALYCIVIQT